MSDLERRRSKHNEKMGMIVTSRRKGSLLVELMYGRADQRIAGKVKLVKVPVRRDSVGYFISRLIGTSW